MPETFSDLLQHHALRELLELIKEYHYPIRYMFCTGVERKLMNVDSQITEYIINDHLERRIPILTIHDSYIVPFGLEDGLLKAMKNATEWITGYYDENKSVDYNQYGTSMYLNHLKGYSKSTGLERDYFIDNLKTFYQSNPEATRTKGYLERFAKHKSFYGSDLYPDQ